MKLNPTIVKEYSRWKSSKQYRLELISKHGKEAARGITDAYIDLIQIHEKCYTIDQLLEVQPEMKEIMTEVEYEAYYKTLMDYLN